MNLAKVSKESMKQKVGWNGDDVATPLGIKQWRLKEISGGQEVNSVRQSNTNGPGFPTKGV